MADWLHIISGESAGASLREAGVPGAVLVWRDLLYEGQRDPGWPSERDLERRANFLEHTTGGAVPSLEILDSLRTQYRKLKEAAAERILILWFDACLFDQAMLAHILSCLRQQRSNQVELICVDSFPGIDPFHGLGQLEPAQLASCISQRVPVSAEQFALAMRADAAFASQDAVALAGMARAESTALPWLAAAARRWLQEWPDPQTGLGRLEHLALSAIRSGCQRPDRIYRAVAESDEPPQFWGDTTLWARINGLADRVPPLVGIAGPTRRLPQWKSQYPISSYAVTPVSE